MRFGICCGPGSFAPQVEGQPLSAIPRLMETMGDAGADYVEFGVAAVTPEEPDAVFEGLRRALQPYAMRVEAFNSFIPAAYPITGPNANHARAIQYCRVALSRCKAIGGEVVVLGSAGARRVPDGFGMARARQQLVEFCKELGPVAEDAGIDIALEPLNSREDNLVIGVDAGAQIVDAVNHPRIQLLADLYHMSEEREPLEHVAAADGRLRHTHCADLNRAAPGFAEEGEEDFLGFFRNLRAAGYDRRCSFEGRFEDIARESKPLLVLLRKRWEESAAAGA